MTNEQWFDRGGTSSNRRSASGVVVGGDRIVERHLARFWETQQLAPSPAMGATPDQPMAAKGQPSTPPAPSSAKAIEVKKAQ